MSALPLPCLVSCLPYFPAKGIARFAVVKHFLPSGWSPAYKFTVFEDAFLVIFVEFDESGVPIREDDGFHLARPVAVPRGTSASTISAGTSVADAGAHELPMFELVWPLKMDGEFTRQVACAFAHSPQARRADKRNSSDARIGELTCEVHHKLRRLSFNP
ncbi:hypothetical protein KFE25_008249 [Diacronema lutheri]|uniref:Uncharacterized protein n=2 Tax=Diacronema lutheri TaxID=2081491 RepID=A0A8J5XWR0_DIALT|nr:hypothetical protein KFE25_008249 [Diacronema lutheri]